MKTSTTFTTFTAIDPGTTQSGVIRFVDGYPYDAGEVLDNELLICRIRGCDFVAPAVIEDFRPSGNRIGMDSVETIIWIGRFFEAALRFGEAVRVPRRDVKRALCGNVTANDAGVWMAVVDEFGGKIKAIGDKSNPGPLYGIKSHVRQAVALGMAYMELGNVNN